MSRRPYHQAEVIQILERCAKECKENTTFWGNTFWKELAIKMDNDRTWESMKNKIRNVSKDDTELFKKYLPNVRLYYEKSEARMKKTSSVAVVKPSERTMKGESDVEIVREPKFLPWCIDDMTGLMSAISKRVKSDFTFDLDPDTKEFWIQVLEEADLTNKYWRDARNKFFSHLYPNRFWYMDEDESKRLKICYEKRERNQSISCITVDSSGEEETNVHKVDTEIQVDSTKQEKYENDAEITALIGTDSEEDTPSSKHRIFNNITELEMDDFAEIDTITNTDEMSIADRQKNRNIIQKAKTVPIPEDEEVPIIKKLSSKKSIPFQTKSDGNMMMLYSPKADVNVFSKTRNKIVEKPQYTGNVLPNFFLPSNALGENADNINLHTAVNDIIRSNGMEENNVEENIDAEEMWKQSTMPSNLTQQQAVLYNSLLDISTKFTSWSTINQWKNKVYHGVATTIRGVGRVLEQMMNITVKCDINQNGETPVNYYVYLAVLLLESKDEKMLNLSEALIGCLFLAKNIMEKENE